MYTRVQSSISANEPGSADATLMAYGYLGGDGASIWHLLEEDRHAWEKLRTFAFRSACAACARINVDSLWALEQLVTHRWSDHFEIEKIANSPAESIHQDAVDNAEISLQANHVFTLWRRGEIADHLLQNWSDHPHWRIRWFGAQILASLKLQRTVALTIEWLRREQVPIIRGALLDALQRSETVAGANALLETFEAIHEGAPYFAKVGWLASDKELAAKALNNISDSRSAEGAEALVSLARLGFRHQGLKLFLDSHDYYNRLNAMLALGYLGDIRDLPRLVQMQTEAANPMERIYAAASIALLGQVGSAKRLHHELIVGAERTDYFQRVDIFQVHGHLQSAVLGGLEACGQEARPFLEAWRTELEPFESIANAVNLVLPKFESAMTDVVSAAAANSPHNPSPLTRSAVSPEVVVSSVEQLQEQVDRKKKNEPDVAGSDSADRMKNIDGGLLVRLGKIAGVGGIGLGVCYLLLKSLHFQALDSTAAKVLMFIVFGMTVISLIVWAARDRKNNKLAGILAIVAVVIALFGWLSGSNQHPSEEGYLVTIDVLKQDASNATTNEATVAVHGRSVSSNEDGRSWTAHLGGGDKGHTIDLTADVPGAGLHAQGSITPAEDHQPTVHLNLVPGGAVDVKVLVVDENGLSVPDAMAFVVGGRSATTDVNGQATLKTEVSLGEPIGPSRTTRQQRAYGEK
jgi:hypothetical protein